MPRPSPTGSGLAVVVDGQDYLHQKPGTAENEQDAFGVGPTTPGALVVSGPVFRGFVGGNVDPFLRGIAADCPNDSEHPELHG